MTDPTSEDEIRRYAREAASKSPFQKNTKVDFAEQQKIMRETGPYLTLGIQLALSIALFFGLGWWLDKHFGTGPLWTAIATSVGAVLSLVYFLLTVIQLSKKEETKKG